MFNRIIVIGQGRHQQHSLNNSLDKCDENYLAPEKLMDNEYISPNSHDLNNDDVSHVCDSEYLNEATIDGDIIGRIEESGEINQQQSNDLVRNVSTINTESNKIDSANHYVELGDNQNHQQKHMFDIRSPLHERSEDAISSQECTAYNLDEKESISDINGEELSSAPSPKKKVEIKKMNETKLLQDHMKWLDKKEIRLMKNRQAARECRRKKKEYVTHIENKLILLEEENRFLKSQIKILGLNRGIENDENIILTNVAASSPIKHNN